MRRRRAVAKAASELIRPWCDQESTSCAAACGPTPGWSSSCGASLRVSVSISRASSRSSAVSCSDAAGDRAQREQAAAQLGVALGRAGRVAARRCSSRARVSGRSSLRSGSGVVISRSRSWQSPARLALTAPSRAATSACNAWRSPPARGVAGRSLREHAAGGTDRVERVGLAARAALPPQPADLEHPLTAAGQEASQTGTERAGAFDRERTPTAARARRRASTPARSRRCSRRRRLEHDHAADDLHDRERVRVAVRVDTDDVVQLICKHPRTDLQPSVGGHEPVPVWGWKPRAAEL